MSFFSTLKSIYQRLPVPSTNFVWRKFPVNPYDLLPPNPVVYDIGSKDARGHYAFGAPPPGTKILCIDIFPSPGVDIVADAHDLSILADGSADFVAAVGMLLHCKFPEKVMSEFYRVLKPGGVIYLSGPFIFTECDPPTDYAHYSIRGLEHLGRNFTRVDSGFGRGPASAMCYLLVQFAALLLCFNSRVLFGIWTLIFSYLLFWLKYLDLIVGHYQQSNLMYGGAYFIGRKQQGSPQAGSRGMTESGFGGPLDPGPNCGIGIECRSVIASLPTRTSFTTSRRICWRTAMSSVSA